MEQQKFTEEIDKIRWVHRNEADAKTAEILADGMIWRGFRWSADKEHFDDYRDICQQIMTGLEKELLVHGIGEDAYMLLNISNVQEFFITGKTFKINTLTDGYKVKDLGGVLSTGQTVKSLKDMTLEELRTWKDPRI
jgi:hypothetical protein